MAEEAPGVVTPVVPVAPAADAAPAPESTADQVVEAPEGEEKPEPVAEKMLSQSEVNKLIAKTRAQESRRLERVARAEAEASVLRKQLEDLQKPVQTTQPQGRPQSKDFADYESYMEALTDWKVDQKLSTERESSRKETQQQRQQRDDAERAHAIQSRLKSAEAKYDDFREVVTGDVPFTEAMVAFIGDSEQGGEVAYHLGNNVDEAVRISKLSPAGQFRELVKLESKLSASPRPTQTPPPIVPSGNKASAQTGYRPDMTDNQYAEWRRKDIAKRR